MIRGILRLVRRIVLLLLLVAAALYIYHRLQPPQPAGPPGKVVVPGAGPSKPVGSPEPDFLIKHAPDLGLSPEQVEKLRKTDADFQKTSAPLRKELDQAGKEVADELNRLSNEKVKLPYVEERTRLWRELSGKLADLRQAAWRDEQKVLTPEQRQKALDAWAKVHQLIPGAAPEKPATSTKPESKPQGGGG